MRFCTTHRACWRIGNVCEVRFTDYLPTACTLVDALIVAKEDGEWPAWAVQALKDGLFRSGPASQEMVGKRWGSILDALERAEP